MNAALLAKLRRLPEMSGQELGYRLRERMRRGVDRAAFAFGSAAGDEARFLARLPREGSEPPSALGYLEEVAPRFYLPVGRGAREARVALLSECLPGRIPRIAAEAERLAAHRIELLGFGEVDCGRVIDWHRDPVGGGIWERRFWADYDLVHERGAGDPKRVHELNRHQHLPRLAKAYFVLGEERYAREVVDQLLGWIEENPPGLGVNWHSSLEIALRAVSWLWSLFFILPSEALDEAAARTVCASLFAQLDHVAEYPSVFSSPNTHLVGEATALFLGGLVFADAAGGSAWLERGADLLVQEAGRQVCRDGVHGELSTWYHAYTVEFYLQALILGRADGFALDERVARRLEAMLDFLLYVAAPNGRLPRLGDDDGGRALALAATDYDSAADLLATGAVVFAREDFKAAAGGFSEPTLWLLGREGHLGWQALEAAPPERLRASFPEAGYFVQRSGWGPSAAHMVFDCGGLGTLGGGHGHADALSLTLSAGGRELLVDPGTFVYRGGTERPAGGGWRDAFRATAAHNTVVVDGDSQSAPGGAFRWQSEAPVWRLDDLAFEGVDCVAGEHHGYARPPAGVVHRRRLLYARPATWWVLDDFRGVGEHTFDVLYHLAPGAVVDEAETSAGGRAVSLSVATEGAGLTLFLHATARLEVSLEEGWVSRRYGEKRPAPVVVARFRTDAPAAVISVLAPDDGRAGAERVQDARPRPRALVVRTSEHGPPGLGVGVARGEREDLAILAPGAAEAAVEGGRESYRLTGEAFWARLAGGRLERAIAFEASRLLVDGVPLLAAEAPRTLDLRRESEAAPHLSSPTTKEPTDVWHRGNRPV